LNNKQFLLVEPVAKTPYPPLGLMKISSMLKRRQRDCEVFHTVGNAIPQGLYEPRVVYITSLFTWDTDKVVDSILYYKRRFPKSRIRVGGIAASLIPNYIYAKTGVKPHAGLLKSAESCPPDYSMTFGRKIKSSISFTSRGCIRKCQFCNVNTLEPWLKSFSASVLDSVAERQQFGSVKKKYQDRQKQIAWYNHAEDDPILLFIRALSCEAKRQHTRRLSILKEIINRYPSFIYARKELVKAIADVIEQKCLPSDLVYAKDLAEEFLDKYRSVLKNDEIKEFEKIVEKIKPKLQGYQ